MSPGARAWLRVIGRGQCAWKLHMCLVRLLGTAPAFTGAVQAEFPSAECWEAWARKGKRFKPLSVSDIKWAFQQKEFMEVLEREGGALRFSEARRVGMYRIAEGPASARRQVASMKDPEKKVYLNLEGNCIACMEPFIMARRRDEHRRPATALPCGHTCLCAECVERFSEAQGSYGSRCPLCRTPVGFWAVLCLPLARIGSGSKHGRCPGRAAPSPEKASRPYAAPAKEPAAEE